MNSEALICQHLKKRGELAAAYVPRAREITSHVCYAIDEVEPGQNEMLLGIGRDFKQPMCLQFPVRERQVTAKLLLNNAKL